MNLNRFIKIVLSVLILTFQINADFMNPNIGPKYGQIMGEVQYSDIVAYINEYPVKSYNIDGNTWICVEDLADYGFDVEWDAEMKTLIFGYNSDKEITADYVPDTQYSEMYALYSSVKLITYIDENLWYFDQISEYYNIGGKTIINADVLAEYFAYNYTWDAINRILNINI